MDDLSKISERIQWSPDSEEDYPAVESMRGSKPEIRKKPSTDQKKIRSQMRRSEQSRHTAKGVSSMSDKTEADYLRLIASAPDRATQQQLAAQLETLRANRTAKARQDRAIDFGATYFDRQPLISQAANWHTADTDWMGEIEGEHDLNRMHQEMVAHATVWYNSRTAAVKNDLDELAVQANGYCARVASQYGSVAPEARESFIKHVEHLVSRTADNATVQSTAPDGSASSLPVGVENEKTFDTPSFPETGSDAEPSNPSDTPSLAEGDAPEGSAQEPVVNQDALEPSHDGGPGPGVHPTKDDVTQEVIPAPQVTDDTSQAFAFLIQADTTGPVENNSAYIKGWQDAKELKSRPADKTDDDDYNKGYDNALAETRKGIPDLGDDNNKQSSRRVAEWRDDVATEQGNSKADHAETDKSESAYNKGFNDAHEGRSKNTTDATNSDYNKGYADGLKDYAKTHPGKESALRPISAIVADIEKGEAAKGRQLPIPARPFVAALKCVAAKNEVFGGVPVERLVQHLLTHEASLQGENAEALVAELRQVLAADVPPQFLKDDDKKDSDSDKDDDDKDSDSDDDDDDDDKDDDKDSKSDDNTPPQFKKKDDDSSNPKSAIRKLRAKVAADTSWTKVKFKADNDRYKNDPEYFKQYNHGNSAGMHDSLSGNDGNLSLRHFVQSPPDDYSGNGSRRHEGFQHGWTDGYALMEEDKAKRAKEEASSTRKRKQSKVLDTSYAGHKQVTTDKLKPGHRVMIPGGKGTNYRTVKSLEPKGDGHYKVNFEEPADEVAGKSAPYAPKGQTWHVQASKQENPKLAAFKARIQASKRQQ